MYTNKYEKYTKWHCTLTTGMYIYAALNVIYNRIYIIM